MTEHLSDEDLERIAQFAATPAYEREPEQLLPERERPVDDDDESDPVDAPRTKR